jgi:hypothetical protein
LEAARAAKVAFEGLLETDPSVENHELFLSILKELAKWLKQDMDESDQKIETIEALLQLPPTEEAEFIHELLNERNKIVLEEPWLLCSLALAKMKLAMAASRDGRDGRFDDEARRRLLLGARDLLRRAIQMDAPAEEHHRAWKLLALVLEALEAPETEIATARKEAEASG